MSAPYFPDLSKDYILEYCKVGTIVAIKENESGNWITGSIDMYCPPEENESGLWSVGVVRLDALHYLDDDKKSIFFYDDFSQIVILQQP
jgi:hypothetical protein